MSHTSPPTTCPNTFRAEFTTKVTPLVVETALPSKGSFSMWCSLRLCRWDSWLCDARHTFRADGSNRLT